MSTETLNEAAEENEHNEGYPGIAHDFECAKQRVKQLEQAIERADQILSGIQYYANCKTARGEAAVVRKILRGTFVTDYAAPVQVRS